MIVTPSDTGLGRAGGRVEATFFSHGLAQDTLGRIAPLLVPRSIRSRRRLIRPPLDTVSFEKCGQLHRWNDCALADLARDNIPGRDQFINSGSRKAKCVGSAFDAIRQWRNGGRRCTRRIWPVGTACLFVHYRIQLISDGHST